ncbi:MAG: SRPBCC domain-containing protein [Actinomycetia bacterium]|nr:SRPBCC domain-containing protein [Actinomycetes bacterium]
MIEPLVVSFRVDAPVGHAFAMWTQHASLWWPRSHTITKDDTLDIVFEDRVGGRIYERSASGAEHDWGEIITWDPPTSLEYLWFLFFDRSDATDVSVSFVWNTDHTTVTITQTGFERLGDAGAIRKQRSVLAWETIGALFVERIAGR